MSTLEALKANLGDAYRFTAKYDRNQLKIILKNNSKGHSDEVPYSLEAGCVSIEVTLFHNGERLYPGYDVSVRSFVTRGEWASYDSLPDKVNLDSEDMEQELFRILDDFVGKNNLSYTELNVLKGTDIESKYPKNPEL